MRGVLALFTLLNWCDHREEERRLSKNGRPGTMRPEDAAADCTEFTRENTRWRV